MTPELRITVLMENTAPGGLPGGGARPVLLSWSTEGRRFLLDAGLLRPDLRTMPKQLGVDFDGR